MAGTRHRRASRTAWLTRALAVASLFAGAAGMLGCLGVIGPLGDMRSLACGAAAAAFAIFVILEAQLSHRNKAWSVMAIVALAMAVAILVVKVQGGGRM